ncbi:MAG TPA: helix-turn-helix transcriptional regulator [Rubrobacteraceae bacterium]|nr:helix-turn-helix transcriptional regulator [Rubrobacteraceae bacterium]
MTRRKVRSKLIILREERMWTQGRLAEEARVSPTTVSGIESGRISRPHFGTLEKLARALGVDPRVLVSQQSFDGRVSSANLSFEWAVSSREEEFEESLERATLGDLHALLRELGEEHERLRELYGEAQNSEKRRTIKRRIRTIAAQHGSVQASIAYHPDLESLSEKQSPGK